MALFIEIQMFLLSYPIGIILLTKYGFRYILIKYFFSHIFQLFSWQGDEDSVNGPSQISQHSFVSLHSKSHTAAKLDSLNTKQTVEIWVVARQLSNLMCSY